MFLIGLTGGVAAGKSSASKVFKDLGVPVIDADELARQVVDVGRPAYHEIRKSFGNTVIKEETGEIDRDALRNIILNDPLARQRLQAITHPRIRTLMIWGVVGSLLRGHQYAVLEVPLLFESGSWLLNFLHKIVVVVCERDFQLQRLMESRQLSERESTLLIDLQMPLEQKAARGDFVIENSGNFDDLIQQVVAIHDRLKSSYFHWKIRLGIGLVFGSLVGGIMFAFSQLSKRALK